MGHQLLIRCELTDCQIVREKVGQHFDDHQHEQCQAWLFQA